jgi:hypothetical protein
MKNLFDKTMSAIPFPKNYLFSSYRFNLAHQMGFTVKKRGTPHAGFFYIDFHPVSCGPSSLRSRAFYVLQNEDPLRGFSYIL